MKAEELTELIGSPPSWMTRWGMTLIFVLLAVLLGVSMLFNYSDILTAPAELTSSNPPVSIIAKTSGKIDSIFVHNLDIVQKNQIIAKIENPDDFSTVIGIKRTVRSMLLNIEQQDSLFILHNRLIGVESNLSELLPSFKELSAAISSYNTFCTLNESGLKSGSISSQKQALEQYKNQLIKQSATIKEDLLIGKFKMDTDSALFAAGAIPIIEFKNNSSQFLQKQLSYQSSLSVISQLNMQKIALEKDANEIKLFFIKEDIRLKNDVKNNIENMLSQIYIWEKKYLITSPISGTISLFNLRLYQSVNSMEDIFYVMPINPGKLEVIAKLPIYGSAKVEVGQEVILKFSNYPVNEYGSIKGMVGNISVLPKDSVYLINIQLPNELKTNTGNLLIFKPQMIGVAEIITEKKSILKRIFDKISSY